MVRGDGGDLELVDVGADGVVHVRLHGACIGCPSSAITLTMGIERNLKDQIPEVTRVVCASP
jgi:Fe-S cluster biogenesis protein NfuA